AAGTPLQLTAPRVDYDGGRVEGQLLVNSVGIAVTGHAGPAEAAVLPFDIHLVGGGLAATVAGTTAAGTTAQAAIEVLAPDLSAASGLAGRPLPPLRDVRLTAPLAASGPTRPEPPAKS